MSDCRYIPSEGSMNDPISAWSKVTYNRLFPLLIVAPDGRELYLEVIDGEFRFGGGLPAKEAAAIYLLQFT
jgi:hypothetical protein